LAFKIWDHSPHKLIVLNSYFVLQARNISAQFEERHEAKTVGEMKLFVGRLPQMQVKSESKKQIFLYSLLFYFSNICYMFRAQVEIESKLKGIPSLMK
jgi:hypothetical protein